MKEQIEKYVREGFGVAEALVGWNDEDGYIYIRTKSFDGSYHLYRYPITKELSK